MRTTIIIVALSLAMLANAAKFKSGNIFYNTISAKKPTVEVTKGNADYFGEIKIPAKVTYKGKSYAVTGIEPNAFDGCYSVQSITLPNTLIRIGERAFNNCTALETITLPASLVSIGENAFNGCFALGEINVAAASKTYSSQGGVLYSADKTTLIRYPEGRDADSIQLPEGVTTIGKYAFYACTSLQEVVLPTSLTNIETGAFEGCTTMRSIAIPQGVSTISSRAFALCKSLRSIELSTSTDSIASDAFLYCKSIREYSVPEENKTFSSKDGILYNQDKTTLLSYPLAREEAEFRVPNGVVEIADYAFCNSQHLTSIYIPKSVKRVGVDAFKDSHIQTVKVPKELKLKDSALPKEAKITKYKFELLGF